MRHRVVAVAAPETDAAQTRHRASRPVSPGPRAAIYGGDGGVGEVQGLPLVTGRTHDVVVVTSFSVKVGGGAVGSVILRGRSITGPGPLPGPRPLTRHGACAPQAPGAPLAVNWTHDTSVTALSLTPYTATAGTVVLRGGAVTLPGSGPRALFTGHRASSPGRPPSPHAVNRAHDASVACCGLISRPATVGAVVLGSRATAGPLSGPGASLTRHGAAGPTVPGRPHAVNWTHEASVTRANVRCTAGTLVPSVCGGGVVAAPGSVLGAGLTRDRAAAPAAP